MYDVIIIGAGPSGMMAAISASDGNKKIAVLERNNKVGKKLYATGNGRCNYINRNADHAAEVEKALYEIGLFGSEESDGRVYPKSREAASVVRLLEHAMSERGVECFCDFHAVDVARTSDGFKVLSKDGRKLEAKKLVIASGGKAGIQYGSYGEAYRWAQIFGHSLRKPIPALVGLDPEDNIEKLHGVRVNAEASLLRNGELVASEFGEVQFTKDSISGICVMDLSRNVRLSESDKYSLSLDLYPEASEDDLQTLLRHQKESCGNALESILPEKLREYAEGMIGKNADAMEIAKLLKNLSFTIKGTKGWDSAQVTCGGVPTEELSDAYESKKIEGLYIIGEAVDYDGPCGGYNLCHAFWSGMAAGENIRNK